jgi:hypothetical protein
MTHKEAIDWCEQFRDNIIATGVEKEKYTLALKAMRTSITALEKQIPQKVIRYFEITYQAECPACKGRIEAHASHKYCRLCGQAIEWEG